MRARPSFELLSLFNESEPSQNIRPRSDGGREEGRREENAAGGGSKVQRENRDTTMVVDDGGRRSRCERTEDECEAWTASDGDDGERRHRVTGCGLTLSPTNTDYYNLNHTEKSSPTS